MKIKHTFNLIFNSQFLYFLFNGKDLWVEIFCRMFPITVQIETSNIATEISIDNSIDINHGKNFKCVVFKQL